MNITVYCGSMRGNSPVYAEAAEQLGTWIGAHGHCLVYGGGGVGLMGVLSDAVLNAGGHVHGVMPRFLVEREASRSGIDELEVVETMDERKEKMIALGDAFVALPGGPGTVEEISEVISLEKLGKVVAPCVLYNVSGFYDPLISAYDRQVDAGFTSPAERACISVAHSLAEFEEILLRGATSDRLDPFEKLEG